MDMIVVGLLLVFISVVLLFLSRYKVSIMIGKSMRPNIQNFAIGIYDTKYSQNISKNVDTDNIILFTDKNGKFIAHRVIKINEQKNKMYVKGDNPQSSQHIIDTREEYREDIDIKGIMVSFYPIF